MTQSEKTLLLQFLGAYYDHLGAAGCNDHWVENTEGNMALVKNAFRVVTDTPDAAPSVTNRGIFCEDFVLIDYLRRVVERLPAAPGP